MRNLARPATFLLCVLICGCGKSASHRVSGKITFKGQPLAGAEIALEGTARGGKAAQGFLGGFGTKTDAEGKFEIQHARLQPGSYRVLVARYVDKKGNVPDDEDYGQLKAAGHLRNSVPDIYSDSQGSDLFAEVKEGNCDLGTLALKDGAR